MPDQLLDDTNPVETREDREAEPNAAASVGVAPVPPLSISPATAAEADHGLFLRVQASALLILAAGAVLSLIYFVKLILVVVLISILMSFVLAPVVDFLNRFDIPRGLGSLIA